MSVSCHRLFRRMLQLPALFTLNFSVCQVRSHGRLHFSKMAECADQVSYYNTGSVVLKRIAHVYVAAFSVKTERLTSLAFHYHRISHTHTHTHTHTMSMSICKAQSDSMQENGKGGGKRRGGGFCRYRHDSKGRKTRKGDEGRAGFVPEII